MQRESVWVDLFAGAGGTSTGLALAAERLGLRIRLTAINHWGRAIETHSQNHPWADHIQAVLEENTNPRSLVQYGSIDGLVASPECTEHSVAKGDKEIEEQRRASAFAVLRFVERLRPKQVLIENVRQFTEWGPLDPRTGKKDKRRNGEIYRQYIGMLRAFGYTIEEKVLNCADYGDPTKRFRLFIRGRLGSKRPLWPDQTHDETGGSLLGDRKKPWRTAEEIVNLDDVGDSIFKYGRLCDRTIERILKGLDRYCTSEIRPFIVILRNHGAAIPLNATMPALTAAGQHFMLCQHAPGRVRTIQEPLPAIQTTSRGIGLAQFVFKYYSSGGVRSLAKPLDAITTRDRFALVTAGNISGELDIRYRMFRPRELARAHSFPDDYRFSGGIHDQVRQIGNSVPVSTGTELTAAMLADWLGYSREDIRRAVSA